MKIDYKKLVEIIKTRRLEKGISEEELSKNIGVSQAKISQFERGIKLGFDIVPFVKLCEELDINMVELLQVVGIMKEGKPNKLRVEIDIDLDSPNDIDVFTYKDENYNEDEENFEEFEEEIEEEFDEEYEEEDDEFYNNFEPKECCKSCKYYCDICNECTRWE